MNDLNGCALLEIGRGECDKNHVLGFYAGGLAYSDVKGICYLVVMHVRLKIQPAFCLD
jgi:hypothetical protein